jgi:transcriptional regulator of nitric oxide reductase
LICIKGRLRRWAKMSAARCAGDVFQCSGDERACTAKIRQSEASMLSPRAMAWHGFGALVALAAYAVAAASLAEARPTQIDVAEAAALFGVPPGVVELGPYSGPPESAEVRLGGNPIGYVFSTHAVSGSIGYSGKALDVHVGLRLDGRIAGARLAEHQEPILVIGVTPAALEAFVAGLADLDVRQPAVVRGERPDHVAGATVSSAVIKDAVLRAARAVAGARGLLGAPPRVVTVERVHFVPRTWGDLAGSGAIASRRITRADVERARGEASSAPDVLVSEIYTALISPPEIGQNLLGRRSFEKLVGSMGANEHAVLIAANGLYSFKGTAWRQEGRFDRIRLVQGPNAIAFAAAAHENVEQLRAEGAPELREAGVFRIPQDSAFDPAAPWRLELIVDEAGKAPAVFPVDYQLPARFLAAPAPAAGEQSVETIPELWREIWRKRSPEIVALGIMLAVLTGILFAHDLLVRNGALYREVRLTFLIVTLVFLGGYAGAQLSVVNVVTFAHALLAGFRWEQFLLDPLVFILWSFLALALLFWGRGVFCGWLCPFGALQELSNSLARRFGVRQFQVPWALHERLWPLKYAFFLAILGLSFHSARDALTLAEVEPFKTAIVLKFDRAWPFVLYAVSLLGAGLFVERFYCRYLCPLGAALAIPARLKIFDWLKRRPQCGRECRICAVQCPVQSINPLGQIVPNECIYCLKCQTNYFDAATCLPLKQRAQRRGGGRTQSAGRFEPAKQTVVSTHAG